MLTWGCAIAAAVMLTGPENEYALEPARGFTAPHEPVMIQVHSPRDFGRVTLTLQDHVGRELCEAVHCAPGAVDLGALMPKVWDLRRAAYVQIVVGDDPAGTALVIEPILTPLQPVTEHALRRDGRPYPKVIGWTSPLNAEERAAATGVSETPEEEDAAPKVEEAEPVRAFSGLRVYLEHDVILKTSEGAVRIALRPDEAPNTARNFRELCAAGFFEGLVFHRIVPMTADGLPFVVQGGDPSRTGSGGPGYQIDLEPSALPHDLGVISMARSDGPNTAGSQFFVCLSREGTARLDGQYCAFGVLVSGKDVLQAIAGAELANAATGQPVEAPVIHTTELVPAPPRRPGSGRPDAPIHVEAPIKETPPARVPR